MPTNRFTGAAAVSRRGVSAGTIDSRSGSARVTPAPLRNVRRGMCFLVRNMIASPDSVRLKPDATSVNALRRLHSHLKLRALHDAEHDCRKPVVLPRGVPDDRPELRHIVELDA